MGGRSACTAERLDLHALQSRAKGEVVGGAFAAGPLLLEAGAAFDFPDPIALVVVTPGLCQVRHVADVELGSGLGRLLVSERETQGPRPQL